MHTFPLAFIFLLASCDRERKPESTGSAGQVDVGESKVYESDGDDVDEEFPVFQGKSIPEKLSATEKKGISIYNDGTESLFDYTTRKRTHELLKFDNIENGYDSLQIRIVFHHSMYGHGEVLIIKKDITSWKINALVYNHSMSENYDYLNYSIGSKSIIYPVENIHETINKLNALFLNFTFVDTLNYRDGGGVTIELATKNKYRKIKLTRNHLKSAAIEKKLILLLKEYFDFPTEHIYLELPSNAK